MKYNQLFLGCPGTSKTTLGLSSPGVEQHVFGSSEEATALNFTGRKDILQHKKYDWFSCLTPEEQAKFTKEDSDESALALLTKRGRAKAITKYRRYIFQLKSEMSEGKAIKRLNKHGEEMTFESVKNPDGTFDYPTFSIFLDNGTPFSEDFQDYVEIVYGKEFETKEGNFNSIAFSMKFQSEVKDFFRMLTELPCNVNMSFHISMVVDEQTAARVDFMKDSKAGIKHAKEWQPMLMGKAKYALAGLFDYVFYLQVEENPGQATKYIAKLEADDSSVGIAKSRLQPFVNPRRIEFPKNKAFEFLDGAVKKFLKDGTLSPSTASGK